MDHISKWCDLFYLDREIYPQQASILFSSINHDPKMHFLKSGSTKTSLKVTWPMTRHLSQVTPKA
jgi:hypothetical protein